jgi:hypothetical protein
MLLCVGVVRLRSKIGRRDVVVHVERRRELRHVARRLGGVAWVEQSFT